MGESCLALGFSSPSTSLLVPANPSFAPSRISTGARPHADGTSVLITVTLLGSWVHVGHRLHPLSRLVSIEPNECLNPDSGPVSCGFRRSMHLPSFYCRVQSPSSATDDVPILSRPPVSSVVDPSAFHHQGRSLESSIGASRRLFP